jgi:hypothetical protein
MKFDYKTKYKWVGKSNKIYTPFYKYNHNIGYIPADIHFTSRGKQYNTSNIMTSLATLYKYKLIGNIKHEFTFDNWYTDIKFNKNLFIKFTNELNIILKENSLDKNIY